MGLVIEQLQDRHQARNPGQWDWLLLKHEEPLAGNHSIFKLNFSRVIKPARTFNKLSTQQLRARMRKAKALPISGQKFRFMRTLGRQKLQYKAERKVGGRWS